MSQKLIFNTPQDTKQKNKNKDDDGPLPARIIPKLRNKIYGWCGDTDIKDQHKQGDPVLNFMLELINGHEYILYGVMYEKQIWEGRFTEKTVTKSTSCKWDKRFIEPKVENDADIS